MQNWREQELTKIYQILMFQTYQVWVIILLLGRQFDLDSMNRKSRHSVFQESSSFNRKIDTNSNNSKNDGRLSKLSQTTVTN